MQRESCMTRREKRLFPVVSSLMFELRLLGQFQLTGHGEAIELKSPKLCALLGYLACLAPRRETRDRLATLLWGSHFEAQAQQNLRQALARLRKIIGSDALLTSGSHIWLSESAVANDVRRFETLVADGTSKALRAAVALIDGELLAGIDVGQDAWEEWLAAERRRLNGLVADALVRLGEIEIAGDPNAALGVAERALEFDFYREAAHRLAMRALADSGRRSEAIRRFQGLSDRLKRELDALPEPATRRLADSLRALHGSEPSTTAISTRPVAVARMMDKPSIAVLPFANMSADPEQGYFADGMVEEIITALSRMHWLFVIARGSSFTYRGPAIDVQRAGRELGVRYILEGSVRRSANRVRISGQLIDAETGAHLWADRFEGALEDIFDLQDQVTASVVGAIAPKLEQAEIERSRHKPTDSLDAYDYYLRGLAGVHQWNREANEEALSKFRRAIELDPNFGLAYGMAGRCFTQRKASGWVTDRSQDIAEAERFARRAAELGREDAMALCTAGNALAYVVGDLDNGTALIDRSLALNPNLAWAWLLSGWARVWLGEAETAIEHVNRAMRLSPQDPHVFSMQAAIASAHFIAGRYAEAYSWAEEAVRGKPIYVLALTTAAASAALSGRAAEAERAMVRLRQLEPLLRVSNLQELFPLRQPEYVARWEEGLRRAGLPE
jgi:TolB-like protein/two-component SAPR family response regulator